MFRQIINTEKPSPTFEKRIHVTLILTYLSVLPDVSRSRKMSNVGLEVGQASRASNSVGQDSP